MRNLKGGNYYDYDNRTGSYGCSNMYIGTVGIDGNGMVSNENKKVYEKGGRVI